MSEVDFPALSVPVTLSFGVNLLAEHDFPALAVPAVASVRVKWFHSKLYTYPLGNITIRSENHGAKLTVSGTAIAAVYTLNDLSTLATFLGTRLGPGNGLGAWSITASGSSWTLKYNGVTTGATKSQFEWQAVAEALWLYLG